MKAMHVKSSWLWKLQVTVSWTKMVKLSQLEFGRGCDEVNIKWPWSSSSAAFFFLLELSRWNSKPKRPCLPRSNQSHLLRVLDRSCYRILLSCGRVQRKWVTVIESAKIATICTRYVIFVVTAKSSNSDIKFRSI